MDIDPHRPLIAVNVGNTRLAFGLFANHSDCQRTAQQAVLPIAGSALPMPAETFHLDAAQWDDEELADWLSFLADARPVWAIGSVNRPFAERLGAWIARQEFDSPWWLQWHDTNLPVRLNAPERVGIDRLLAASAAHHLGQPGRASIVVDLGTAITVDLVSAEGEFMGGAILPGLELVSDALNQRTDALPRIDVALGEAPPSPIGSSTAAAIEAGLFWGTVGGIAELVAQIVADLPGPQPNLVLTGGHASLVVSHFRSDVFSRGEVARVLHVPHLVLSGIALTYLVRSQNS